MTRFPIHSSDHRHLPLGRLRSVPWSVVAPHVLRAERNHGGQTLERLAERGGFGLVELAAVLLDKRYREVRHMSPAEALAVVEAFEAREQEP